MPKWEYKIVIIEFELCKQYLREDTDMLNTIGSQGWELVNIIPQIASENDFATGDVDIDISCCKEVFTRRNVCVFKRQLEVS